MNLTSPKLENSNLTPNEAALRKWQLALDLRDSSDYEGARAVMQPLWKGVGERPAVKGLQPEIAAEVLLTGRDIDELDRQ